jgi:hypothetical protein
MIDRHSDVASVGVIVVASAVAAALSGAHPTGSPVIDAVYLVLFGAALPAAGSIAGRATLLWMAGVAAGFSRGYVIFPAFAALLLSFGAAVTRRPIRPLNALAAAVSVQVVLRLPHTGFHGGSALVAAAAVAPCLFNAIARLPRWARLSVVWTATAVVFLGIVLSIPVAIEAGLAHTDAARGTTAAEDALRAVSDGDAAGGTAQLQAAQADFGAVASRVGAWWTAGARLVPVASQQRKAVLTGSQVARDVSAAAGAEAGQINFGQLHYQAGGLDLARVEALQAPLRRLDTELTGALGRLHSSQSQWLVQPLASRLDLVTTKVAKAQKSASLAALAVGAAPSLLGGQGTRHYLALVMDPSESRGLGGLVVSYGIVTASGGHLSLGQFQDISKFNAQVGDHGGGHITGPADFLVRYGQNPALYSQNVTYSPDLPTVTQVMSELYSEAGFGSLDGVLVVDPTAIASLLNFSGPVEVAGIGQMTSSNADQILERGQYAAYPSPTQQTVRRNALTGALSQALSSLTHGSLPGPLSLANTLDPDVRAGDLLFWSVHPNDQPLLERIGMAGAFPKPDGGDLVGVVTSNGAANKIDAYLQRTIDDQVHYNRSTGHVDETVRVTLHNEAPAQGVSSEVIGSYTGSGFPPGTNRLWLNLYSPLQLVGGQLDGHNLPLTTEPELGVNTYSTFVTIPAGGTVTATFQVQGQVSAGGYGLHVYSQPMALPDHTTITVYGSGHSAPSVWTVAGQSRDYRFFSFAP